jgi:tRNA A37 threonylcarbamoyladenosine modification protein TsaB
VSVAPSSGPLPALAVCGSGLDGAASFTAAVATGATVVAAAPPVGARGDLAVLAADALRRAGVPMRSLRSVRVDRGPGSYIGLRVAVTFARFVAAFADAQLLALDSLAAAAAAALAAEPQLAARRLCPVLDGRQDRVQIASYRGTATRLLTERAPLLCADAALAPLLHRDDVVLAAPALHARLAPAVLAAGALLRPLPRVTAATLFAPELAAEPTAPAALEPCYLTGSYV